MANAAGGRAVTIEGTHLDEPFLDVRFGSQSATTCSKSSTELQVIVPPSVNDQAGPVSVTVTTINGMSHALTFTYTPDPVSASHLDDNRLRFTTASVLGLSFLPSWLTGVLPGITGRVIPNPSVHALFWDSNWDQDNPGFSQSTVSAKLNELVNSSYLSSAGQYDVGPASSTGVDGSSSLCPFRTAGSSVNPLTLWVWITCEAGGGVWADTEAPGTGGVQGIPQANGLPLADNNTDYVIFMPTNSQIGLGSIRSCSSNGGDFDAFHFFTVVNEIQWNSFLFLPDPTPTLQTVPFVVAPAQCASDVTGLIDNVSHELVESATDPLFGLGWIENSQFSFSDPRQIFTNGEASDICEQAANGPSTTLGDLTVERYWSNQDNACVPSVPANCAAPSARLLIHPRPTLTLKPAPLHAGALADLRRVHTYVVHGSVAVKAYGPQQPAVSSTYTIEQQGPTRALFEGRTKIGKSRWVSFEVVQVGRRRCVRGARGWVCLDNMPAFDTHALISRLMSREFRTRARTTVAGGVTTVRSTQGNVAFASVLDRSPQGMPMQLTDVARVWGKPQGTETVVFDYSAPPPIRLPK